MKQGLSFFPWETFADGKFRKLKARCGFSSSAVLLHVLMHLYGINGYYIYWTDEDSDTLAYENSIKPEYVTEVINACVDLGYFDKTLFEKYSALTSAEIQNNFLVAAKRRKSSVIKGELRLLEKDEDEEFADNFEEIVYNSEHRRVDKKRVDKKKVDKKRVDKKRLDKITLYEKREEENMEPLGSISGDSASASSSVLPPSIEKESKDFAKKVIECYNDVFGIKTSVKNVSKTRTNNILEVAPIVEDIGGFQGYFSKVAKTKFLCGVNDRSWKASFDWLIKKENAIKVIEGYYDDCEQGAPSALESPDEENSLSGKADKYSQWDDFFKLALLRSYDGDIPDLRNSDEV